MLFEMTLSGDNAADDAPSLAILEQLLMRLSRSLWLNEQMIGKVSQLSRRSRDFGTTLAETLTHQEEGSWRAFLGQLCRPLAHPRPAASQKDIEVCQERLHCRFPCWLRALYGVCDGQNLDDTPTNDPEGILCGLSPLRPLDALQPESHNMGQTLVVLAVLEGRHPDEEGALVIIPETQRVEQLLYHKTSKTMLSKVPMFEGAAVRRVFSSLELQWQLTCAVIADDADAIFSLVKSGADPCSLEWQTPFNASLLHTCSLCKKRRGAKPLAAMALLACRADPNIKLKDSCWMTGMDAVDCAMEFHPSSVLESLLRRGYVTPEDAQAVLLHQQQSDRLRALDVLLQSGEHDFSDDPHVDEEIDMSNLYVDDDENSSDWA